MGDSSGGVPGPGGRATLMLQMERCLQMEGLHYGLLRAAAHLLEQCNLYPSPCEHFPGTLRTFRWLGQQQGVLHQQKGQPLCEIGVITIPISTGSRHLPSPLWTLENL